MKKATAMDFDPISIAELKKRHRRAKAATLDERLAQEKRTAAPNDGRRLRTGSRTVQLNVRISPERKEQIYAHAKARGVSLTDAIEEAIARMVGDETP
jgi:predicted HicB family RNase H-like nuclease